MKVKRCCCCVPIEKAITILGFLLFLNLFEQLKDFNPIVLVANGTALGLFIRMEVENKADNRRDFLFGYIIYLGVVFFFGALKLYMYTDDDHVKKLCEHMQADGKTFKEEFIRSMDECN